MKESPADMDLPNLDQNSFALPDLDALRADFPKHRPRILLLYGSLRDRSYSRFLTLEAQRLLDAMGLKRVSFMPMVFPCQTTVQ